jgi:hypothetical protein
MECMICRDLERAYELGLGEYIKARSSAFYRVSKKFAAEKNVDMERTRYELEEHRLQCVFAVKVLAISPERDRSAPSRQLAA